MTVDLEALLADKYVRGIPPEIAKARKAEQVRRSNRAQDMAYHALARLHPDDYRELRRQANAKIRAEAGPLPGDPE